MFPRSSRTYKTLKLFDLHKPPPFSDCNIYRVLVFWLSLELRDLQKTREDGKLKQTGSACFCNSGSQGALSRTLRTGLLALLLGAFGPFRMFTCPRCPRRHRTRWSATGGPARPGPTEDVCHGLRLPVAHGHYESPSALPHRGDDSQGQTVCSLVGRLIRMNGMDGCIRRRDSSWERQT